jgi:hypothetical protein
VKLGRRLKLDFVLIDVGFVVCIVSTFQLNEQKIPADLGRSWRLDLAIAYPIITNLPSTCKKPIINDFYVRFFFFIIIIIFFDMSTQEGDGRFELVTSAS